MGLLALRVGRAVHNLGLALSFCSCSVCKKKQNRHFIVPASRFKLLKVSAKSRADDAEPIGESSADGSTLGEFEGTRSAARLLWEVISLVTLASCSFVKVLLFFPLYFGCLFDITKETFSKK